MERLTSHEERDNICRNYSYCNYSKDDSYRMNGCATIDCDRYKKVYDRLIEYEDEDESGLLARLPVKVGELLYEAKTYGNIIGVLKVTEVKVGNGYSTIYCYCIDDVYQECVAYSSTTINKTLFLTREYAENALKKIN